MLLAEKEQAGTISLRRFYLRRALRIFPLYYAIIALAWWLHNQEAAGINFGSYLYFLGNFWMVEHSWTVATLNPLWSLCIEEQFYLVIPVLVALIPTRRLPWLFDGIVALSILFRAYITLTADYNWMSIYCHTLSRCDVLALGGWLAWRHFTEPVRLRLPAWTLSVALLYLALLLTCIDVVDYTSVNFALFKKYLHLLPLGFIFCCTLFNQTDSSAPTATIMQGERVINYLGKISFGLYMYHSPIIFLLDTHPAVYAGSQAVRLPLILVLTVLTAALSYELFEKQILRLKSRFEVVRTARA